MSYAVCRMEKMKSHDLKGMQFHNQRERESKTNSDIDKTWSHENYDLVNQGNIDYNERVKDIIESQKISPRKTWKDAVLVNELLITSDKDFFDALDPSEQKRFFEESYKLFAERYGKQNIAYATVHVDEKTPHLHLGVVPMRDGKLQGKNVFNRNELLAIQEEFPKHMQKCGFDLERGVPSDRKHLDMARYKLQTTQEKINSLENELAEKEHRRTQLNESIEKTNGLLKALKKSDENSKEIDMINYKESGLIGPKTVKLALSDFESMKTKARASEAFKIENKVVSARNKQLSQENNELKLKNKGLNRENQALKHENRDLTKQNMFLTRTLESLKYALKEHVKDFDYILGAIKSLVLDNMKVTNKAKYLSDDEERLGAK
ncbi:MobV family relaxase, partial [Halolactibacillus halophilus]